MQRIPLERHFEFIPAQSVLKSHGHLKNFRDILSAIERGALHGLIAAYRFGLKLQGIRLKLVEMQIQDVFDLETQLFQCAFDAVENGVYSGEVIFAETLDMLLLNGDHKTGDILFKGASNDNSLYQVTPYEESNVMVYSTHRGNASIDVLFKLNKYGPFTDLKPYVRWMIPLSSRLNTIYDRIKANLAEDDISEFEKWTSQSEFSKKIRLFEEKNPKIAQNQHWITEQEFSRLVRESKTQGL